MAVLVAEVLFIVLCNSVQYTSVGNYLDPTMLTNRPKQVDNAASIALTGTAAPWFWPSVACAAVATVCAAIASLRARGGVPLAAVSMVVAIAATIAFRVVTYLVAFPAYMVY